MKSKSSGDRKRRTGCEQIRREPTAALKCLDLELDPEDKTAIERLVHRVSGPVWPFI
jgi:hypothetical protein